MSREPTYEEREEALRQMLEANDLEIRADRAERRRARLRAMGFSKDAIEDRRRDAFGLRAGIPAAYAEDNDPYYHGLKPEECHEAKSGRLKKGGTATTLRRTIGLYGTDSTPRSLVRGA